MSCKPNRTCLRAAALSLAFLTASIAAPAQSVVAGNGGNALPAAASSAPAASAAVVVPPASGYLLQCGDDVDIKVHNVPELNETAKVRPDGKISVPLMDDVQAAGRTPVQVADIIARGYSNNYRDPKVTLVVRSFANQNIFVGGEVAQPGVQPLRSGMTAAAALFQAGGIRPSAKLSNVIVLRDSGNGKPTMLKVDLARVLEKGGDDLELHPFDVVFVPKSKIAKVDQWIDSHIKQVIPLSLNGGFSYLLGGTTIR